MLSVVTLSLVLLVLYIVGVLMLGIFWPDSTRARWIAVMLFIIIGIKLFAS